jgi:hypothetical protein
MARDIHVFQDEDANYCIITGTSDRKEAEAALRRQEEEWFGPLEKRNFDDAMEKPFDFDKFSPATIYQGQRGGEEGFYYWGNEPGDFFDRSGDEEVSYTEEPGFMATLD